MEVVNQGNQAKGINESVRGITSHHVHLMIHERAVNQA